MGRNVTVWSKRPFKITYTRGVVKVGRIVSCSSPEAVVRGTAEVAKVSLEGDIFAMMHRRPDGLIQFTVY